MKKISLLLTCALVMALAVPAFAAEDNVKITGEVKTVFEIGNYSSGEEAATVNLWADDDALDLDNPFDGDGDGDMDDYPAEKAFYQEIDFNVAGNLDNINFNLAVDTLTNVFSETSTYNDPTYGKFGVYEDDQDIVMDTALLTVSNEFATLKAGDLEDYNNERYFIYDDEDMEGVEVTTNVSDYAVKAFVLGEDDDDQGDSNDGSDYYGVTATKNFANGSFTGKLFHARTASVDDIGDLDKVTDVAGALTYDVNDVFTVNGEVVFNSWENGDSDDNDSLFNLGANYQATDTVTLRGKFETVGEQFAAPLNDLEETADYDLFNVGADFVVNANNTLKADYTLVSPGDELANLKGGDEDKNTVELSWDNVSGAFTNTASVEFTAKDGYADNTDVTVFTVGTKYAMSDVTTVTGKIVNQSADDYYDNEFTYLAAGLNTKLSDSISWNTEAKYITGSDKNDKDGEGNSVKTVLAVSF